MRLGMAAVVSLFGFGIARSADRQLIQIGWDAPTPPEYHTGIAEFEKWNLFDGAAVQPTRRVGDKSVITSAAFSTNHWEWSEFADCVRELEAARPQHCTNNFLLLTANPGNVGWFDDAGWNEVADHWRLLARAAREGRMAGIIFDAEPYQKPWSQFSYSAQVDREQHRFVDMSVKARERGRAVMKAVAGEYPDMTILAYRLFSDLPESGDPARRLVNFESSPYGLMPSFVNGWCDSLPAKISIVDGNEFAYGYESENDYASAFARLKLDAPRFVSAENRGKMRQQFFVGHGIYLDAYSPPPGGKALYDFKEESPANRLAAFLAAALDAADGPVWIYGENARWWPKPTNRVTWPEKFAGIEMALRAAKDPVALAGDMLRDGKSSANILKAPDFEERGAKVKSWQAWQSANSKGKSSENNKVAVLAGMENGALSQTVAVKAGETYAIGARVKAAGVGDVGLAIGWQKTLGKWVATSKRMEFTASGQPDAEGWREIAGVVHVPREAADLVFLFFARKQDSNGEVMFKDPRVVRVSN